MQKENHNPRKIPIVNKLMAFCLCAALLPSCSLNHQLAPTAAEESVTQVYQQGDTIFYIGAISNEANQQFARLLDKNIKTLKISSRGGEIMLGMDLGEIVFENGLNVEVDKFCFSSCANYVFPAGKRKILNKNSLLGWHGGALQKMVFDDAQTEMAYKNYIAPAQKREAEYFKKIRVSQISTIYGQRDEFASFEQCAGWSYSVKAMQKLGMKNILLSNEGWEPEAQFNGKCIFTINDIAAP